MRILNIPPDDYQQILVDADVDESAIGD